MAGWTDYAALMAALASGKAFTDEKAQALAENVAALAEGAPGAPRVLGRALGSTYLSLVSVTGTTPQGWMNLARMETIKLDITFNGLGTANNTLQIRFSSDNGLSYGAYQNIFLNNTGSGQNGTGVVYLNLRTGQFAGFLKFTPGSSPPFSAVDVTLTVPAGCNAFQIRGRDAGTTIAAIAWCFGGLEA